MGGAQAKEIRGTDPNKGELTGEDKMCVAPFTVAEKKMELIMNDIAEASWAFRAGNAEVVDSKGKVLYKTEAYSTNDKMFSVRVLSGETGQTLCIGVCKDVSSGEKVLVRILRPNVPAYKGQADFASWAREDRGVPLYPFAMIEIINKDGDPSAAQAVYKVTVEEDFDPKVIPLYTAKVFGDIASLQQYLLAVYTYDAKDKGKLVAKIDQKDRWVSKSLAVEVGQGVDVCAVVLMSLFFGVTKGMVW